MFSTPSQVVVGADHAGHELKQQLVEFLEKAGVSVKDLSPALDPTDDYPLIAHQVAAEVAKDANSWGILVCGTGIGMSMAANRHPGVRAALVYSAEQAKLAREHNAANILVLAGRFLAPTETESILTAWMNTSSSDEARHLRRIDLIDIADAS